MRKILLLLLSVCGHAFAQDAPKPPQCDSYFIQKGLSRTPPTLSLKQRFCLYGGSLFSGQAIFGSAFFSGIAQLRDDPVEWEQGTKGYLRRLGTRYGQSVAKTSGEFAFSTIFNENPRYQLSGKTGFWKRTVYAGSSLFVVKHLDDPAQRTWPAFGKLGGATSSAVAGLAWYPGRLNTPTQLLQRGGSAYGGYLCSAIFQEFQPDIFHLLSKLVGSDRGSASQPKAKGTQ